MNHWSQRDKKVYLVDPVIMIGGKTVKHLCSPLRVTHIAQFISLCLLQNQFDLGWKVEISKLSEGVGPELSVFVGIQFCVLSTEGCSSIISEPNIVPIPYHYKCRCYVGVVNNPGCGTAQKSMLEKYNWSASFRILTFDSVNVENVAIGGGHLILLVHETRSGNNLLESLVVFNWFF